MYSNIPYETGDADLDGARRLGTRTRTAAGCIYCTTAATVSSLYVNECALQFLP